ncbi:hypothetical protein [Paenibacillus humicola]|uniref:hypothetical protein n=1 Tax=Paenibacillus humicola TaxID=3110540 RepID=UPI00237B91AF|nr:hypothetical protein [Paenibacillus humicola]
MKTVKLRPFVPSGKDYSLAQRFFEELGFERTYSDDSLTVYRTGEQEFLLQHFHHEEFQQNYMLELAVDSLDEWWAHIQALELTEKYPIKVKPPTVYPWGKREIHLIDPAGVCWHFSEPAR